MAGAQITPGGDGVVQQRPKLGQSRAAGELLEMIKELAAFGGRTLEAFIYFGVPPLVGFEVDRQGCADIGDANALDMLRSAAAAGGSVCVVHPAQGCAFHGGSPATAVGVFAFGASGGGLLALSAKDKERILEQMDRAFHSRGE